MSDDKTDTASDDLNDAEMTDAEREMMSMLGDDGDAQAAAPDADGASAPDDDEAPPPVEPTAVHPVEMDAVKTVPPSSPNPDVNLKLILDIPVEVKVEVGNSRLTIQEVLNLAPGSIVELDRTAGSPADLIVNGTKVGQGDVVVVEESYGIRITKLVDPEERLNSL